MGCMKKGALLILATFLFFVAPVLAAENDTTSDSIQKAYQCLQNEIGNKSSSALSLQEAIFSMLALGDEPKLRDKIESERSSSDCWPKASCRLKETAQVLLAYDRANRDTTQIEEYLTDHNGSTTDLSWFLMIDIANHVPASCTVKHGSTTRTFSVGEDMKLSGDGGSCF